MRVLCCNETPRNDCKNSHREYNFVLDYDEHMALAKCDEFM